MCAQMQPHGLIAYLVGMSCKQAPMKGSFLMVKHYSVLKYFLSSEPNSIAINLVAACRRRPKSDPQSQSPLFNGDGPATII